MWIANLGKLSRIFPVHTGVFLIRITKNWTFSYLPRTHGGVSVKDFLIKPLGKSSPYTRGCFFQLLFSGVFIFIFPVHTGVFPLAGEMRDCLWNLPRTHGGVSRYGFTCSGNVESSPYTRGCFYTSVCINIIQVIFPVHTGVFPIHLQCIYPPINLPRTHGGVSVNLQIPDDFYLSSPYTRGCF